LSARAFASKRPGALQTWYCVAEAARVEFARADFRKRERFDFPRTDFEVAGTLPSPAL